MKHFVIILILLLLLAPLSEAISLGQGVIIKPNSTANGSFIINQTAIMDEIVVNDTDVKFSNIGTNYQLVESINSSGGVLSVLCPNQVDCTLSQVMSNIMLLFTNNITTPVTPNISLSGTGCGYNAAATIISTANLSCNATSVPASGNKELDALKYVLLTVSIIGIVRFAKNRRKKKKGDVEVAQVKKSL